MPSSSKSKTRKEARAENFRSGFEKKGADNLTKRKVKFTYEKDRIPYVIPASKHNYCPDFILDSNDIVLEFKGKFDAATRRKMALVIEQNPNRDIRMVFMRDNKISKTSKTKYSDWCEARGIKCHVSVLGEVPEAWVKEKKK